MSPQYQKPLKYVMLHGMGVERQRDSNYFVILLAEIYNDERTVHSVTRRLKAGMVEP
jgi:hypothetical protein